jgi:hypothetical protein
MKTPRKSITCDKPSQILSLTALLFGVTMTIAGFYPQTLQYLQYPQNQLWAWGIGTIFTLLGVYITLYTLTFRLEFDDEYIYTSHLGTSNQKIPWEEILKIRYEGRGIHINAVIHTEKKTLRLHTRLLGIEHFLKILNEQIPQGKVNPYPLTYP